MTKHKHYKLIKYWSENANCIIYEYNKHTGWSPVTHCEWLENTTYAVIRPEHKSLWQAYINACLCKIEDNGSITLVREIPDFQNVHFYEINNRFQKYVEQKGYTLFRRVTSVHEWFQVPDNDNDRNSAYEYKWIRDDQIDMWKAFNAGRSIAYLEMGCWIKTSTWPNYSCEIKLIDDYEIEVEELEKPEEKLNVRLYANVCLILTGWLTNKPVFVQHEGKQWQIVSMYENKTISIKTTDGFQTKTEITHLSKISAYVEYSVAENDQNREEKKNYEYK